MNEILSERIANLRTLQLPRDSSHDIDCVCSAHANTQATETAAVRRVTVSTNHEQTRERIILQDNLRKWTKGVSSSYNTTYTI